MAETLLFINACCKSSVSELDNAAHFINWSQANFLNDCLKKKIHLLPLEIYVLTWYSLQRTPQNF